MENIVEIAEGVCIARFEPDHQEFSRIAEEGFRSVVSLQTDEEDQKVGHDKERRLAEEAGLTFYHQPVSKEGLSDEAVDRFRAEFEKLPKPVLLHCSSGKRAGAMAMMHLTSGAGMSGEDAINHAEKVGFECDTPELEEFVRSYVDRH